MTIALDSSYDGRWSGLVKGPEMIKRGRQAKFESASARQIGRGRSGITCAVTTTTMSQLSYNLITVIL